ncbi:MAG: hypothetical protein KF797_04040 [Flavobacteriales bacterium]|nr:hypothetical protein [Flavobacteriales bacterium]
MRSWNAAYFFLAAFLAAFLGAAFLAAFFGAAFLAAFFGAAFLAAFFAAFFAMANGFVCVKRNCADVNVYACASKKVPPYIVDIVDRDQRSFACDVRPMIDRIIVLR